MVILKNTPYITHSAKQQKLVRVARAADAADIKQKLTSSGFPTQIKRQPVARLLTHLPHGSAGPELNLPT